MHKLISIIVLFISTTAFSQKEFEGIITYKVTIVISNSNIKESDLYKEFGVRSLYYFKAGKHKWSSESSKFQYEIFNPTLYPNRVVTKLRGNDTINFNDYSKNSDTVKLFIKLKPEKVLNIQCNTVAFTVTTYTNKSSFDFIRTITYPADSLRLLKQYYNNYRSNGHSFINRYCKSIPLKLELADKDGKVRITYEAVNIEWKKLNDNEFKVDSKLPTKH